MALGADEADGPDAAEFRRHSVGVPEFVVFDGEGRGVGRWLAAQSFVAMI